MSGYWKSEDSGLDENNWFKTGDIARIDETGNIFIVDRKKDMILVSGFNVYPNEVEAVVNEHSAVLECGCVGVEDGTYGKKGFVTDVLEELLGQNSFDAVYTCGPELMMYTAQLLNQLSLKYFGE